MVQYPSGERVMKRSEISTSKLSISRVSFLKVRTGQPLTSEKVYEGFSTGMVKLSVKVSLMQGKSIMMEIFCE